MRSRIARFAMRQRAAAAVAVLLVVVMAGTALAASRGNAWRLGYVETLSAYATGITGIHTAELLRITNTNTSTGARAIRAEGKSAAAGTIYARNTGGGPAAEFVVNANKAPFKVNSARRIPNLNADKLDGRDSTQLEPSVRWAVINAAGSILDQSGGITVEAGSGGGSYWIGFGSDISRKAILATHRGFDGYAQVVQCAGPTGVGCVASSNDVNHIFVYTRSSAGAVAGRDFYVAVMGTGSSVATTTSTERQATPAGGTR